MNPRLLFAHAGYASWRFSLFLFIILQLLLSACVAAGKCRPVLHHCVEIFFWSSRIMDYMLLKMLCLYLLGQICLHLTSLPYLGSETYSREYVKLPNIVIHAGKSITEKVYLLKMCAPQIRLCLFTFRPIASKQLNSLTTIDSLSCLGGAVVTYPPLGVRGPGFNSRLWQGFLCLIYLYYCCCVFTFCSKTHYLSQHFAIPFSMFIY